MADHVRRVQPLAADLRAQGLRMRSAVPKVTRPPVVGPKLGAGESVCTSRLGRPLSASWRGEGNFAFLQPPRGVGQGLIDVLPLEIRVCSEYLLG